MKKYHILFNKLAVCLLLIGTASLYCCKKTDGYNQPSSDDLTKPGIITDVKVDNFNGGSHITYKLPNSENLLYVLAQYKINGEVSRETKSSYYSDSITVNGFAESKEYEVNLYAVSRTEIKSDPVTVKVNPDTPIYRLVRNTVALNPDFGGMNVTALNPKREPVGLIILIKDRLTSTMDIVDQYYTESDSISYSLRGLDTVAKDFGVYIRDRFGNISDTLGQQISPLYETLLDKSKFSPYRLPNDNAIAYGWELPNLWNGNTSSFSTGWHTAPGGPLPVITTFGIGVSAKLSRFVLWERANEFAYSHGNPRVFSLWGSDEDAPRDILLPRSSPEGTVVGDWVNLGNFVFPNPPSGLPPTAINENDRLFVANGVSFNVPIASPKVKFIRLCIAETWSRGDFAHLIEMSLYGDPNQ